MISFNLVPNDIRTPGSYIEVDASRALTGLPTLPARILVIGQRLASGQTAALTPVRMVTAGQAVQAFGRGSQLAQMIAALKGVNDVTECWAIALDDVGGGTAATGTVTIAGTATANGTLPLMIQGLAVPVGVTAGDTAATIATNIVAAIAAKPDLIVTAAANGAVVTLTCRHKGTLGNDVDIRVGYFRDDRVPTGITATIAAMSGGATDPDISAVWPVIGDARYTAFILPGTGAAALTSAEAELLSRWGPLRQRETMAYAAYRGSFSAAASFGNSRNSYLVSVLAMRGAPWSSWQIGACYGGAVVYHGSIDPARPLRTIALTGMPAPATADVFTRQERDLLLRDGISTFTVDASGVVLIDRAITMFQTDVYGVDSVTWLDVTTPLTLAYMRYSARTMASTKYPRHKLADDNTRFAPGQAIMTPRIMRAELLALARDWEAAGLLEDYDQFAADLIVERDATDRNRLNALLRPNIVNQFQVFAAVIQFLL